MSKILIIGLSALMLSACSNQHARRGDAFDRADKELGAAAASKTNQPQGDVVGQAMVPPLQLDQPMPAKPEPRFNLAVNNAPVAQVLNALVSGTPYSMLFPPDLSGTVSLNLKSTTVREALETLREVYGYDYRIQGTRIYVQPNTIQTRIFKINYLANRRQGMSDMRVTGSSPTASTPTTSSGSSSGAGGVPGGTTAPQQQRSNDSARVQTSSDYDFWKDLGAALNSIVGNQDGRNVIVNAGSGVVLVKASPVELRSVDEYLRATQLVVERQVMLEAKIIEVSLNDSYQTGINWSKFGGLLGGGVALGTLAPGATLSGAATLGGSATGVASGTIINANPGSNGSLTSSTAGRGFFGLAFQSQNFAALLSFLEGQGDVQVLSSPRIATTNNQKAVLKVGTDDFFVTGISTNTTTSASGNVVTPNITLQPFFSGIALDVTPQIDDEGNIILHVHPSVSVVEEKTKNVNLGDLGTFTLPLASSTINETDSIVRVQDGSIVAIGGLMSQEQNTSRYGLPGIGGLPGVGSLFSQKSVSNRKRELVILMRSTVIKGENSWRDASRETQERVQGLDPRQQRHLEWQ
ncbi:MAG: pilus (MSHA type) biogenesis protein MshL [Dechloromonas sp.]|uniref:pilus (MSHA type) biogenesis protein MshL n=1 Tax=Azonexaceae TaxID=2008795 RepID=UPI001CF8932E|nr:MULTISPECIES: pilus (MSHA type) biogenesis protein MshL [Azonexaceae]MBT9519972.1 pilus (MSHA type) biogenesis protein MshL [Dechloromonas sp.]UCV23921.1 pilus (MSHA type) biogenesis protein MshL [Ferribacterium limneticum]